ncbi:MAG TPA: hypothetical protein VK582_25880 [Pyrinomonadaceae bacterium]|nr:hypothetical protein [Pyrinomonadaceae bacterium]
MSSHTLKNHSFSLLLLAVLMLAASSAIAQDKIAQVAGANVSLTATATSDRVRFAAPSAVVQLRLEVYDGAGQKLVDTDQRGGNVLDWHLHGGNGDRVADGTYLFVVTIKNLSGRLSQKLGSITVSAQSTTLRASAVTDLNAQQAQAVGPIEGGEEGLTVMPAGDAQPVTVLANNAEEAQLARTRGALTFRVGDFFSGNDSEQMRLTEEGNLGIGTSEPKAKLDVAGTIRAERFLIVKPNKPGNRAQAGDSAQVADAADSVQTATSGTGTPNRIAKWTLADTLGDSGITETAGGNVGIGTGTPNEKLGVAGNILLNSPSDTTLLKGLFFGTSDSTRYAGIRLASTGQGLNFDVSNGGSQITALNIQQNGNVGIGTTAPNDTLHVGGSGNFGIQIGKTWGVGIKESFVSGIGSRMDFVEYANSDTATARMSILAGKVGIGTTAPNDTLQVGGSGNFGIQIGKTFGVGLKSVFVPGVGIRMDLGEYANSDTFTPRFAILGGKVGIGTTAPNDTLQVGGSGNFGIQIGKTFGVGLKSVFVPGVGIRMDLGEYANSDTFTPRMAILLGNVGIGTTNPQSKLDVAGDLAVSGNALISGNIAAKYQDVAEWVPSRQEIAAGTVVILDVTQTNAVSPSRRAYDTLIAGVVSAQPGVLLGQRGPGKVMVATTGRVIVKVDASKYPIKVGDLLVTSSHPGEAMKSRPIRVGGQLIHRPGTIIGKALEPLSAGKGKILVLLSLQ